MNSTRLSVVEGLPFWSVLSTVWLRKTWTTARLVVAGDQSRSEDLPGRRSLIAGKRGLQGFGGLGEVLLESGGGFGQDLAEVLVEVLVVVAGEIDR